jgi:hypothetical protein
MTDAGRIATHKDPVWRDRANFIIRVDLTPFGLTGNCEQLWTRTEDGGQTYEVCCIPFFTYGIALGDCLTWDETTHVVQVVTRSGRRCIRIAFGDKAVAKARHEEFHGATIASGALAEQNNEGYWALDLIDDAHAEGVVRMLTPWVEDGSLTWEWADR